MPHHDDEYSYVAAHAYHTLLEQYSVCGYTDGFGACRMASEEVNGAVAEPYQNERMGEGVS